MKFELTLMALMAPMVLSAQILVDKPTTQWTPILYVGTNQQDYFTDQQTGDREGDIVGNLTHPGFYTAFNNGGTSGNLTDGTLGFRLRMAENKTAGEGGVPVLKTSVFIGLDGNGDGKLDIFVSAHNAGAVKDLAIYGAGTESNTSPSTTSISATAFYTVAQSSTNCRWVAVSAGASGTDPSSTTTDVDGDGATDYFVSLELPLAQIIAAMAANGVAGFNESSSVSYVAVTAQQDNALNQDFNGLNDNDRTIDRNLTYAGLGMISQSYSASGILVVPEPGSAWLLVMGGVLLLSGRGCRA